MWSESVNRIPATDAFAKEFEIFGINASRTDGICRRQLQEEQDILSFVEEASLLL